MMKVKMSILKIGELIEIKLIRKNSKIEIIKVLMINITLKVKEIILKKEWIKCYKKSKKMRSLI